VSALQDLCPLPRSLVDLDRLDAWMDAHGFPTGDWERVEPLSGGTQNILLRFRRAGRDYVLRRPPAHLRRGSNDAMRREARVLAALRDTSVPHPRLIAACAEDDVLGAAFFLMEPVDGVNITLGLAEHHASSPEVRRRMSASLVEGLAALGRVDPREVGLGDLGRPEGFLERQAGRWLAQFESYRDVPGYEPDLPPYRELSSWLEAHRPTSWRPGIMHGDFHLANVLFRRDGAEVAAFVDWEMSTIGDPLLDLAWLTVTWPEPDGSSGAGLHVAPWDGSLSSEELVAHYRAHSDRSTDDFLWYQVLACLKLASILEGTHARACAGKAPRHTGDMLHAMTVALLERGLASIRPRSS